LITIVDGLVGQWSISIITTELERHLWEFVATVETGIFYNAFIVFPVHILAWFTTLPVL